ELPDSRLSYQWKINLEPGTDFYEVIGDKKNLIHVAKLRPNDVRNPYQILLTVTDNKTGLQYLMGWPLQVLNSLGEGLVVAASKDGNTTDLSLIMAPKVTENYDEV